MDISTKDQSLETREDHSNKKTPLEKLQQNIQVFPVENESLCKNIKENEPLLQDVISIQSDFLALIENKLPDISGNQREEILASIVLNLKTLKTPELQERALILLKDNLLSVPPDKVEIILYELVRCLYALKLEELQAHVFDLLESNLSPVSSYNTQTLWVIRLVHCLGSLVSEDLQSRAVTLLEGKLPLVPSRKTKVVLWKLVYSLRELKSANLQSRIFTWFESNRLNMHRDKIGSILEDVAKALEYLKSETLYLKAFNIIEKNLQQAFKDPAALKLLSSEELSLIFAVLANNLVGSPDSFNNLPEKIKPTILELFDKGLPYLADEEFLAVISMLWHGMLLNKNVHISHVLKLMEENKYKRDESDNLFNFFYNISDIKPILKTVKLILEDEEYSELNKNIFTLIHKRLSSTPESVLPKMYIKGMEILGRISQPDDIKLFAGLIKKLKELNILDRTTYAYYEPEVNKLISKNDSTLNSQQPISLGNVYPDSGEPTAPLASSMGVVSSLSVEPEGSRRVVSTQRVTSSSKFRKAVEVFLWPFKMIRAAFRLVWANFRSTLGLV